MNPPITPHFSGSRFAVEYEVYGSEREATSKANLLCVDQTIEAPEQILPPGRTREQLLGRIEQFRPLASDRSAALISFPTELADDNFVQLLHTVFGTASLKPGIRVLRLDLPQETLKLWQGPRFGREGLRNLVGVTKRPLVCGVLKPLGLSPPALAELAYRFALGGVDFVKDDQGLMDQPFCRFEERVSHCTEAVARANEETGGRCLYIPHATGPWDAMRERCLYAKKVGSGGVMLCPGLTGFDALRSLARDGEIERPIISHPALLGSFVAHPDSGIAPSLLFGQLPRLAGADVTIYPTFGLDFPITRDDCREISRQTATHWGSIKPIFPTAAGRMDSERIAEMCELYGSDVVFILGSNIQQQGGLQQACKRFVEQVAHCST
ncbi:MAG: RuBisCO large subunit C-terminal-like domain-containing protein [Nitrospiraceae bacterium]